MNWFCCHRCQKWSTCDTKWYRGEKGIPQNCCPNCENYDKCYAEFMLTEEENRKKNPKKK